MLYRDFILIVIIASIYVDRNKGGGFASYQSEYPFSMTMKQGSILSSTSSLANKDSEKNMLFFVNIFAKPIKEKFSIYFVNYEKKEIVSNNTGSVILNSSKLVDIDTPEDWKFAEKLFKKK